MAKSLSDIDIRWDIGSAYDFFTSLILLHNPEPYGLRSSWAGGQRQRLPQTERDILATFVNQIASLPPINWLLHLPGPKDSRSVLDHFTALPSIEQIGVFIDFTDDTRELIMHIVESGSWDEDIDTLIDYYKDVVGVTRTRLQLTPYLDALANGLNLIQGVPEALETYYEIFFKEEEQRILPYLEAGLTHTQQRIQEVGLIDLIAEFSRGAKLDESYFEPTRSLTLIPSFWITPFIVSDFIGDGLILFGVRPDDVPLIPGELVPDTLLNLLDTLSNPTRLKILRYVANEELSAAQIAVRLRLRPPTVAHHIKALRLSGLVYISSRPNQKEMYYKTRMEVIEGLSELLGGFIAEE